jgi:hypothetical protein
MIDFNDALRQQKRLPPCWRVSFAPDWGYMVLRPGPTRGENIRSGDFYRTIKGAVDAFLASSDNQPYFPEEVWLPSTIDVRWLDPARIIYFPEATDLSECPNCKQACSFDYNSPLFIGCTANASEPSILESIKPGATTQTWIELWSCPCGWQYRLENTNG